MKTFSRLAYLFAAFLVASYALVTLRGPKGGLSAIDAKRAEIRELEVHNAALHQEIERKREHIRRLTEPAEQELEIRKRLRLIKPNEQMYVTPAPTK